MNTYLSYRTDDYLLAFNSFYRMGATVSVPLDENAAKTAAGKLWDQEKWDGTSTEKDAEGKVSSDLFNAHVQESSSSGPGLLGRWAGQILYRQPLLT